MDISIIAIFPYRIEIKERSIEDMLYELRVLKEKNERLKERVSKWQRTIFPPFPQESHMK